MSRRRAHLYPDAEIAYLQQRIYLHRLGLELSVQDARQALRERLTSSGALLGAAVTGFVLERLTRRPARDHPSTANGWLSIFTEAARTGLNFAQSGPGLWLGARFAARQEQDGQQVSQGPQHSRQ